MLTHYLLLGVVGKAASGAVDLTANGLTTGAASVGAPSLTASGLTVIRQGGAYRPRAEPYIARPAEKTVFTVAAAPFTARPAALTAPTMGQTHDLTAAGIAAASNAGAPIAARSFAKQDNAFWALAA